MNFFRPASRGNGLLVYQNNSHAEMMVELNGPFSVLPTKFNSIDARIGISLFFPIACSFPNCQRFAKDDHLNDQTQVFKRLEICLGASLMADLIPDLFQVKLFSVEAS